MIDLTQLIVVVVPAICGLLFWRWTKDTIMELNIRLLKIEEKNKKEKS